MSDTIFSVTFFPNSKTKYKIGDMFFIKGGEIIVANLGIMYFKGNIVS